MGPRQAARAHMLLPPGTVGNEEMEKKMETTIYGLGLERFRLTTIMENQI